MFFQRGATGKEIVLTLQSAVGKEIVLTLHSGKKGKSKGQKMAWRALPSTGQ